MSFKPKIFMQNSNSFKALVRKTATKYGVNAADVMKEEMRLWVMDHFRFTTPKSRSKGTRAVQNDLLKLFSPFKKVTALRFYESVAMKMGTLPEYLFKAEASDTEIRGRHLANRNRRTGRTRKEEGEYIVAGRNWKNKMHIRNATFNRYARSVKARVGRLKKGFIPAAKLFGAKVPGWVTKAKAQIQGGAKNMMGRNGSGSMSFSNKVPYVMTQIRQGQIVLMLRKREIHLTKHFEKTMQRLAAQWNTAR